jgi:hypothetical protein
MRPPSLRARFLSDLLDRRNGIGGHMSNAGRSREHPSRWYEVWLLSVTQALAMLALSVVLRWMVS